MNKRAIIFDLDGTLLNTIEDIALLANFSLKKHGYPINDISGYQKMVGHGLLDLVVKALPPDTEKKEILAVYNTLIQEYLRNPVNRSFAYDGIMDILRIFNKKKIPMAILSNKMHEITIKIVSIIFPDIEFASVIGSRENVPKKPDPFSALEICNNLGIEPSRVYLIGDSGTDIKTALSAGMIPVGVSWGYRSVADIKDAGGNIIIEKPAELLGYLGISSSEVCSSSKI